MSAGFIMSERFPVWLQFKRRDFGPSHIIDELGVKRLPIPVAKIARAMDVTLIAEPYFGLDGMLEVRKPEGGSYEARIYFDQRHAVTRQRFTIAHELGHLMLHDVREAWRDTSRDMVSRDINEIQANAFAADLLMPPYSVQYLVERIGLNVARLAREFNVSRESMKYRLKNLDLM